MTDSGAQKDEILTILKNYQSAIETGERSDTQAFVHLPVGYISEDEVHLRDRYPFDPVKLRAATGFHHANMKYTVIHMDDTKAHVLVEGTRHREDNSVIEAVDAIYIMQRRDGIWKVAAFSGIRQEIS